MCSKWTLADLLLRWETLLLPAAHALRPSISIVSIDEARDPACITSYALRLTINDLPYCHPLVRIILLLVQYDEEESVERFWWLRSIADEVDDLFQIFTSPRRLPVPIDGCAVPISIMSSWIAAAMYIDAIVVFCEPQTIHTYLIERIPDDLIDCLDNRQHS